MRIVDGQRLTPDRKRWPRWAKAFLGNLSLTGNVTKACEAASVERQRAYELRQEDGEFEHAWKMAIEESSDRLEAEARRRAVDGVDEPVIYQGVISGFWVDSDGQRVIIHEGESTPEGAKFIPITVKRYSDSLLTLLLKGNRPEKFKDRQEISGPNGGPLQVQVYIPDNGRDSDNPTATCSGAVPGGEG